MVNGEHKNRPFAVGDTVTLRYRQYEDWFLEHVSEHGSEFRPNVVYVVYDLRYPLGIPYIGIQEHGGVIGGYVPSQFLVHTN